MDYKELYRRIIRNRQANPLSNEVYGENHHIKPRSLGGGNHKGNIVRLSAREHFICHYCLVEMYKKGTIERSKMLHAFMNMKAGSIGGVQKGQRYLNSRLYAAHREEYGKHRSKQMKGEGNIGAGKIWITKEKINKKIKREELQTYLKDGWVKGRWINGLSDAAIERKNWWKEELKRKQIQAEKDKIIFWEEKRLKMVALYEIYKNVTFLDFVEITGWKGKQYNLLNHFSRYIPEYKNRNKIAKLV